MEASTGSSPRRLTAVTAGVGLAVVVTVGALAFLKLARPAGPERAGASAQAAGGGFRTGPRDPAAGPTTQEVRDAAAARDALRSYFARLATWKMARALDLCHATNGDEQLLATGLAEYVTVQYACRAQVARRFGAGAARRAFGHAFTSADFRAARATVTGDRAEVHFADGQQWPMVKVEGTWRLSMFDYAVSQRRTPAALAAAYTAAVRAHMAAGRALRAGTFETVEAFEQGLREQIAGATGVGSAK